MPGVIKIITFVFAIFLFAGASLGQGESGKFGFGVADLANVSSQNFLLTGRYWISNNLALEPGFGFQSNGQDVLALSVGLLKSIGGAERVYPYFGGKLAVFNGDINDGVSITPVFGADFFFTRRFSLSGEAQLVISSFNDQTSVQTQAILSALFYLNGGRSRVTNASR
jgi:hypothetical protein